MICKQLSVKRLYDNLDYWTMIGIASDIYICQDQRLEYKPLVLTAKSKGYSEDEIIVFVLAKLKQEIEKPFLKKTYIYYLILLQLKRPLRRIFL